jgi:hypothetical protein
LELHQVLQVQGQLMLKILLCLLLLHNRQGSTRQGCVPV